MNTCLVTKMNTVIDNQNLPKFGEMKFIITCSNEPTQPLKQGGIVCNNATITVSNGYVCDSNGNMKGDGHNFSSLIESDWLVSDKDDYVIVNVKDNYTLSSIGFDSTNVKEVTIRDFIYRADEMTKFVFYQSTLEYATKEDVLLLLEKLQKNEKNVTFITIPKNVSFKLSDIDYVFKYILYGVNSNITGSIEEYIENLVHKGLDDGIYTVKINFPNRITFNSKVQGDKMFIISFTKTTADVTVTIYNAINNNIYYSAMYNINDDMWTYNS